MQLWFDRQAVQALELGEGKRETALDLLLAGAIQPTAAQIGGGAAGSGRSLFARGMSSTFDKKLNSQLKTLENLHPGE